MKNNESSNDVEGYGKSKVITGLLAVIMFLVMTATGIVYPIFPQLLLSFDAGARELGYLGAIFSLMITVFAPIGGWVSDKFGKKKMLVLSLFGFSVSNILYAEARSLTELYVYRALEGIAGASVNPIAMALIAIYTPEEKRATYIGVLNSFSAAGFIVGPLLGGVLFQHFGLKAPFYLSGIAGLISIVFVFVLLPRDQWKQKQGNQGEENKSTLNLEEQEEESAAEKMFYYQFYWMVAISFLSFFAWALIEPGLAFYLYEFLRFTPSEFGFLVSIYGGFILLFQPLGGRLGDKFKEKYVISVGMFINAISYLFIVYGDTKLLLYVFAGLAGLSGAIINPSAGATITKCVPESKRTTWMGIFSSLVNTAGFTGPFLGGLIYQNYGPFITFMTSVALSGITLVFFFMFYLNLPQETRHDV